MKKKKNVAVIPARGGSQAIPKKNIKLFEGKPLIAWTIECALAVKGIDRVIVSTDSQEIADISLQYGAEVPFLRPTEISTSQTPIEPVMAHAYEWLIKNEHYRPESVILLFTTCPIRETRHIEEALALFYDSGADSVISVNESPAHYTPYWTLVRNREGSVSYFNGQDIRRGYSRRQDFPQTCFAKNDLVFVIKPQNLFEDPPSLFGKKVELYVTGRIYDADINTPEDWELTLMTYRYLKSKDKNP
ncbi:MAG: acylneuraminate cytidylyltransferase family protein [Deltaproteobacteria bacterium]|nr:acylneuraminate cytidylyltransferase family protein [Deltaproteobacteria bacterium]